MELGACSRVLNTNQVSYFIPTTRFQRLRDLSNSSLHSSNASFHVSPAIPRGDCRCRAIVKDSNNISISVEKVIFFIISLISLTVDCMWQFLPNWACLIENNYFKI
ncbi:hypothetical protein CsSME_00000936 [Camellia sinensis var. sinensis]